MALPFNITPQSVLGNAIFARDILTARFRLDVVAIFDQSTLKQVFNAARPMRAEIQETAKVMDYPVESGVVLSDHKVINPTVIDLQILLPDADTTSAYQKLREAWIKSTKLMVQTRTGVYRNMIIAGLPHREDPDMFNVIAITLRLREVQFVLPSTAQKVDNYAPLEPRDQDVIPRGFQSQFIALTGSTLSYAQALNIWGA